jgi:hypothetical protein
MQDVNLLAVLVAAIASMVVGSVWYGPIFGKKFSEIMGFNNLTPEQQAAMKKGMGLSYGLQFVASLLMYYVLAYFMNAMDQATVNGGLMTAFWAWLGFLVPFKLGETIWGGKWPLFWIGIGYWLVNLLVAGAILGAM